MANEKDYLIIYRGILRQGEGGFARSSSAEKCRKYSPLRHNKVVFISGITLPDKNDKHK